MTAAILFHVQDPEGQPIANALVDAAVWKGVTDALGNFLAHLTPGHYDLTVTASGFAPRSLPADLADPGVVTIGLDRLSASVHRQGRDLANADGSRHLIVGCTDLMLAWRYDLEGADAIRPILEQRRACGFNNLRVLWQKDIGNTGHSPWQMPLGKLRPFLALAAEYGFYVQGTILADCGVVNPNEADQHRRVNSVREATAGIANHFEQLGNEYNKNDHDPTHFSKPTDRLAANSSSTEGGKDAPYWDFFCFSGQRSPLNHAIREYGPIEFMYEWGGVPAICDEGMKPGINSSDPEDWRRAGAQARSGCGGRFHSTAGTAGSSCLFNELELACAQAFVQGMVG
jgi:hypothetical protein